MLQQNEQEKKVALVTGASKRIGAAIITRLHHAGYRVIIHYNHSQAAATKLCVQLNQQRAASAIICQADLCNGKQLTALITQAISSWQRLDVLVNNASAFFATPITQATMSAWDDLFNCNVKAPFFLSQAALPYLRHTHGSIINITDIYSAKPLKNYAIYSMTKAALQHQTYCLARELAPEVRVNAIAPGAITLPEGNNSLTPELQQKIINRIPLQRRGNAEDIAQTVLFLLENKYITGTTITVDGGRSTA